MAKTAKTARKSPKMLTSCAIQSRRTERSLRTSLKDSCAVGADIRKENPPVRLSNDTAGRLPLAVVLHFVLADQLANQAFQFRYAARQIVDCLSFGIGEMPVIQRIDRTDPHHAAGHADHGGIIWDRMHHHGARSDLDVVADADIAEHFGA